MVWAFIWKTEIQRYNRYCLHAAQRESHCSSHHEKFKIKDKSSKVRRGQWSKTTLKSYNVGGSKTKLFGDQSK